MILALSLYTGEFGYGDTTVTCTATDSSGNSSTASFAVRIRWDYDIEVMFSKRVAKAGSTIPIDWVYKDWSVPSNIVDAGFSPQEVGLGFEKLTVGESCTGLGTGIGDDSGSSNFRYSATEMLWQYSWQTPTEFGPGLYRVTIRPPGGNVPEASACIELK